MPYSIDHLEYALWLEGVVSSLYKDQSQITSKNIKLISLSVRQIRQICEYFIKLHNNTWKGKLLQQNIQCY